VLANEQLRIAAFYVENDSGAKLSRPELFRLLSDVRPGDVLLVEQVDRLSRLTASDWEKLKAECASRRVRVVALDLPTSWIMTTGNRDEFTGRMFDAINGMMLDVSLPWLGRTTRTVGVDRRRDKRGRRRKAGIAAGRRTSPAMPELPLC